MSLNCKLGYYYITLAYLPDLCCLTLGTRGHCSLLSVEQGLLLVMFVHSSTRQTRAFSVVGPSVWNGLPLVLRVLPRVHSDTFFSSLKSVLFSRLARIGSIVTMKRRYKNPEYNNKPISGPSWC